MTARRRRVGAAIAVAGLIALTAACSGDDDDSPSQQSEGGEASQSPAADGGDTGSLEGSTGPEILESARQALLSADSMRFASDDLEGMALDIHVDEAGSCAGTVSVPGTGSVEILVREGNEVWMKPDSDFWRNNSGIADPTILSLLDGSYLHGDAAEPEMAMASTCSLDSFLGDLADPDGSPDERQVVAGELTEHNGVPAIPLDITDPVDGNSTMVVAAEGEPYPLLIAGESNELRTELRLSDFNEPVEFEEPPADLVLDLAAFRSGDFAV